MLNFNKTLTVLSKMLLYVCRVNSDKLKIKIMTILQEIKSLEEKKFIVRTNKEFDNIEKQILKLAKMHNSQNHSLRFFIYNGNVYGLEENPNY